MFRMTTTTTLSRALALAAATASSTALAGAAPTSASLPGSTDSSRLAESAQGILSQFMGPLTGEYATNTANASTPEAPFALGQESTELNFSIVPGTPNVQSFGVDEVGRPLWITATSPNNEPIAEIVFRDPAAFRAELTRRAQNERLSYSVLSGGVTINDLLGGEVKAKSESTPDEAKADEGPMHNFRGREVEPASLPYFSDFESGERGMEWDNQSNVTSLEEFSTFTGPLRKAKEVLHVRTEPGQQYVMQLDLYLIGFPPGIDPARSGEFSVLIDGVPMIEQSFGGLRELSLAEGQNEDANGNIIRQLQVTFSSASGVVEIVIEGNTGPGFGTGAWGFDNVLIDNAPETNLGSFSSADFSGDTEIVGDPNLGRTPAGGAVGFTGRTSDFRVRTPRRFRDSSNPRAEQAAFLRDQRQRFQDMFPDGPDEPDEEPDTPEEPEEPETPDEEVPSPGPAALMLIGAGAASVRRRRSS